MILCIVIEFAVEFLKGGSHVGNGQYITVRIEQCSELGDNEVMVRNGKR